jgi:hypothetical protein
MRATPHTARRLNTSQKDGDYQARKDVEEINAKDRVQYG